MVEPAWKGPAEAANYGSSRVAVECYPREAWCSSHGLAAEPTTKGQVARVCDLTAAVEATAALTPRTARGYTASVAADGALTRQVTLDELELRAGHSRPC
jgi:hypothetical protein